MFFFNQNDNNIMAWVHNEKISKPKTKKNFDGGVGEGAPSSGKPNSLKKVHPYCSTRHTKVVCQIILINTLQGNKYGASRP